MKKFDALLLAYSAIHFIAPGQYAIVTRNEFFTHYFCGLRSAISIFIEQFHIEPEALQFTNQHVE
jgi:hypothetical protein